jgi:hypothetical protein
VGVGVGLEVGGGGVGLGVVADGLAVVGVAAAVVLDVDFWPAAADDDGAVGVGAADLACVVGDGCARVATGAVMAGVFGSAADDLTGWVRPISA